MTPAHEKEIRDRDSRGDAEFDLARTQALNIARLAHRDRRVLLKEVDRMRAENERLQHALDNPALRDSVIAGLDQELEAAHREEIKAKAEAKRLRLALNEILDAHQYGHGERWGLAWESARNALKEGAP